MSKPSTHLNTDLNSTIFVKMATLKDKEEKKMMG